MRNKIMITGIVVVVVSGPGRRGGGDSRIPVTPHVAHRGRDENGIIDSSKLPATQEVVDRTGAVVGTVETKYYLTDRYPLPVTGPDGQLVGHFGQNGFWALGESEPVIEGAYTVIEEFDADGERTSVRIIYD